jgi:DNA-directed RNA polymerase specialized sigma24 family protein
VCEAGVGLLEGRGHDDGMRKSARDFLRRLLEDHSPDEMEAAERKITLYPCWCRAVRFVDSILCASCSDMYSERVDGGSMPVPDAQRIVEKKESHPEYQRLLRNIACVEAAMDRLDEEERCFVRSYFWEDLRHGGDHREYVADLLGLSRMTVSRLRHRVLRKMIPSLEDADTILLRAKWAEEWIIEN